MACTKSSGYVSMPISTSFLELTDSLSDSVLWAGGTPISELYGYVLLKSDSFVPIIGCNLPR